MVVLGLDTTAWSKVILRISFGDNFSGAIVLFYFYNLVHFNSVSRVQTESPAK